MRRIVIMGAGGRDFHNFNMVYRDDPATRVVAFTAAQIPGIADRVYPPSLAGTQYPDGIPIVSEANLGDLIERERVSEVVFAYSDVSHAYVMHRASRVMAAGADFVLLGPEHTMIGSTKPVVAVCAVRTGCGKSQISRLIGHILRGAGLRVSLIRHPMPYGHLEQMRIQRFASIADIDSSEPTLEEREEYEEPVRDGFLVWAGVDYEEIVRAAEHESDVIVWDGGNNDFPFVRPDLLMTVLDPLRPGHERQYHPGEMNLRMADVAVINKADAAGASAVEEASTAVRSLNPKAEIVVTASPVTLDPGPEIAGRRVLVVEDGPTLTHGGMTFGAGTVAANDAGARTLVDPRPYAVGSIRDIFNEYPGLGPVLPAMGYGTQQVAELEATIRNVPCDIVVAGTPIDLGRVVQIALPVRRAKYESVQIDGPDLPGLLQSIVSAAGRTADQSTPATIPR